MFKCRHRFHDILIVSIIFFKKEVNGMNSIGQTIKMYRKMLNLTQEELAQKVRVGTHTIEKYESGEQIPSNQTLLKLSTALDIPASELAKTNHVNSATTN
ncbi:helix-turn-helix domain-containing protein [Neobacillus cucumis]|uniref:helix-turn-helix domain-containing protein n=1 Tax=Neobacillus cucumis TaxID=1740721 RepID=UPI001964D7DE|nr:helix-turn-helix transcriptional regulator [Neobacillus cucumis]